MPTTKLCVSGAGMLRAAGLVVTINFGHEPLVGLPFPSLGQWREVVSNRSRTIESEYVTIRLAPYSAVLSVPAAVHEGATVCGHAPPACATLNSTERRSGMHIDPALVIAAVLVLGVACQWLAWRIKVPAILPLLFTGLALGPLVGWWQPQAALGELFFPLVSLSVAVILFEGALTLAWDDVRHVVGPVRNLLTIGALVSWLGGTLGAHYITGLPWDLALLFGASIIVTGPTVIAPILRNVRPNRNVASVLRWEGILIDPIGATVAVLVFEAIVARSAVAQVQDCWHFCGL